MPDSGLPRVLAHGERGSARREPLAGASFGAPFLGLDYSSSLMTRSMSSWRE